MWLWCQLEILFRNLEAYADGRRRRGEVCSGKFPTCLFIFEPIRRTSRSPAEPVARRRRVPLIRHQEQQMPMERVFDRGPFLSLLDLSQRKRRFCKVVA